MSLGLTSILLSSILSGAVLGAWIFENFFQTQHYDIDSTFDMGYTFDTDISTPITLDCSSSGQYDLRYAQVDVSSGNLWFDFSATMTQTDIVDACNGYLSDCSLTCEYVWTSGSESMDCSGASYNVPSGQYGKIIANVSCIKFACPQDIDLDIAIDYIP